MSPLVIGLIIYVVGVALTLGLFAETITKAKEDKEIFAGLLCSAVWPLTAFVYIGAAFRLWLKG